MQPLRIAAVVAALGLAAGCESGTSDGPEPIGFTPGPPAAGAGFVAQYAPPVDVGPYPNDIYNLPGQTLSVPVKLTSPLAEALNTLDGFSTTAPISAPFNAPIDVSTVVPFNPLAAPTGAESLFVLNATAMTPLVPGVHYEARLSTAAGTNGSILEIVPLVPLAPDTTYAFILTDGIESAAGVAAGADTVFGLVRDAHLAMTTTGNPGLDALLPAIGPLIDAGVGLLGLPGDAIVSAWSVSTQSTGDVFEHFDQNGVAQLSGFAPAGTTADLGLGLPGIADLYVGFIELPYFGDPDAPLDSFWVNQAFEPLTREDPVPIAQGGLIRVPVLASLPNAGSGHMEPAAGWPMVALQHGVTANRMVMLTMADSFAAAGFGVVAIDLPLHGVTSTASPLYQGPGNPFGTTERHFNLDNVGDVGDFTPDGLIDNGWQIFNLGNPLNARDHGRQAVVDLIHLLRTLPTMDFDGDAAADVDGARLHFVSVSLGSMFSTALLAVNDDFGSATLTSPGGPFSQFFYDPDATAFGAPLVAGIEAQGLAFGSRGFDNFARDLQTVLDPVDPVNYAQAAAAAHPVHVIEILGDTAVTPALTDYIATLMGLADVSTSTTDAGGVRGIVRFTAGGHSSIFDPSIDLDATAEMQTQTVMFAATNGTTITITDSNVVQ
jgi:hypothetical protein